MRKWTPSVWLYRAAALLVALAAADYLYTAWVWVCWNSRPAMGQDVWLRYALAIREGGTLPLGNDLPLYPAVLALWARRAPEAFTWSKLFSLAVGAATLAATYRAGKELFGRGPAFLAAAALSVNWVFLSLSMSLRAEVLLPPLFLLAWFAAWKGFSEPGKAERWWLAAGAFAGLAYLTKGTGPIFAAAWAVGLALCPKLARKAGWYVLGFAPLAAALWWANRALFGDAARHFSMQHAVWLDSWWELSSRDVEALTFSNYLREHGWLGFLNREIAGIRSFAPVALSCLSPAQSYPLARLLRWPALALTAWAAIKERRAWAEPLARRDPRAWMTASLFAAFFLLFAWYHQVSPSERFIGPLAPIAFLLLAALVWRAAEPLARRPGALLAAAAAAAALASSSLAVKALEWGLPEPFSADRLAPAYQKAVDWVSARGGTVAYGPSSELPSFLLPARVNPVAVPERGELGSFGAWLDRVGAEAAIVDRETAGSPLLSGFFEPAGDVGLRVVKLPEGWNLAGLEGGQVALLERAASASGTRGRAR